MGDTGCRPYLWALLLVVGCSTSSAAADRISRTLPAQPGRVLEVRVATGKVTVVGEDRADVAVQADRAVPPGVAPEALPVTFDERDEAVRVTAQPAEGRPLAGASVRLEVRVPRATPVSVEVRTGSVTIAGTRGALQVRVASGPITASDAGGIVRLETDTGDIRVEAARLAADGLLRLRTVKGSASVAFAERPDHARFLLLALGGRVESTLPLTPQGPGPRAPQEAVLGSGKALVSIDVARGDIRLEVP